ncbi:S-adenosylmethionine mitochondrial carrier protein isoform X3 [Scyliorhinus canicula]|uniref:S-adenosylmethionine mitochondrial carrier protein isoform X3 n=1 Tax=Scyliorhinus canicula TaxID=7830 RepID=UPI0018F4E896|nr:S-adenosylmethionine mitochondrial carrier protein isoform X3 [Scyliorhinus canicula]
MDGREILASLVAGGVAGLCADLTLFPLDTIKTRLQSPQGLYNGGGFRGIYAGIPSTALGSFPNAALFFVTYEYTKSVLGSSVSTKKAPLVHMIAASLGEVIPFSLVQFPMWEFLKAVWSWKQNRVVDSWQAAVCGAFAGTFAAGITTPLDVAKTRIMLAEAGSSTASGKVLPVLNNIWKTQGISGLFSGIVPRVAWISLGGFIFLGTYDKVHKMLL